MLKEQRFWGESSAPWMESIITRQEEIREMEKTIMIRSKATSN